MLFSTQIPSAVNLCIAAAAFLRGLPGVTAWLLRRMPEDRPVREEDRLPVACVLAAQIAGGPVLTLSMLCAILFFAIPLGMPLLAAAIRDFTLVVAQAQVPAHVLFWLSGGR